jgi:hypothetical protein
VDRKFAERTGCNFLTPGIADAVRHRIASPQKHQTVDEDRLYGDLLSSMPMCFNLFGPLERKPELAAQAVARWFPDLCPAGAKVTLIFEWSPGRRDRRWLDDGTAFDVAIFVEHGASKAVIGIETKYHEHAAAVPLMQVDKKTKEKTPRVIKDRYLEVTKKAKLFDEATLRSDVWAKPLEQLWRDHLLALACAQDPDGWTPARYVLVAPAGNPAWSTASRDYLDICTSAEGTFELRTVEQLLASAEDLLPHAPSFRARYLDVHVTAEGAA